MDFYYVVNGDRYLNVSEAQFKRVCAIPGRVGKLTSVMDGIRIHEVSAK